MTANIVLSLVTIAICLPVLARILYGWVTLYRQYSR